MSNFRDTFASRLREVRAQAKELSNNLPTEMKLPSFDDMAAKDAYIHSEEFNVRGQPRQYEANSDGVNNALPEQRQGTTMDSIDEAVASQSSSSSFMTSPAAAWSLLDRPNGDGSAAIGDNNVLRSDQPEETVQQTSMDTKGDDDNLPGTSAFATPSKAKPPTTPLLAIVSETLQDTPPAVKQITPVTDSALQRLTSSYSSNDSYTDSDDDNDSHHSFDEEDPILARMQHDKGFSKIRKKKKRSTNKNRFMEDLDKRLEQPNNNDSILPPSTLEIESDTLHQPTPTTPYFTRGPFGGAVLNMAMTKLNTIVKKSSSSNRGSGSTSPTPPLARARMTTPKPTPAPEDDFYVTTANSVLSANELQELKSKSKSGISLLQVAQLMQEHRHFAFIGFTLLLAVVVYFLTHRNYQDDVT